MLLRTWLASATSSLNISACPATTTHRHFPSSLPLTFRPGASPSPDPNIFSQCRFKVSNTPARHLRIPKRQFTPPSPLSIGTRAIKRSGRVANHRGWKAPLTRLPTPDNPEQSCQPSLQPRQADGQRITRVSLERHAAREEYIRCGSATFRRRKITTLGSLAIYYFG